MKQRSALRIDTPVYFWRQAGGGEVDFVEEVRGGQEYRAYECKYSRPFAKVPSAFNEMYNPSSFTIATKDTVVGILTSHAMIRGDTEYRV